MKERMHIFSSSPSSVLVPNTASLLDEISSVPVTFIAGCVIAIGKISISCRRSIALSCESLHKRQHQPPPPFMYINLPTTS